MLNINIFNVNVEVGTLTKNSESSSEETPSAFDHELTLSRLSCPDASIMIFGTTETRKHHLIGPGGLTILRDVLKWASAYISFA
jgi:hypothetical protein